MRTIIFTIAGIPLSVKCRDNDFLPPSFREFKSNTKKLHRQVWHLESLGIDRTDILPRVPSHIKKKINLIKERLCFSGQHLDSWKAKQKNLLYLHSQYPQALPNTSFYFNDPVEINLKQRKIRHFYLKEEVVDRNRTFNSRLIAFAYSQILALSEGLLLHCACVVKQKKAYLFFAPPSGGKSTVAKLSKQHTVLGDDIIAIRKVKKDFLAFSTPWRQNRFIKPKASSRASIKAVFFLKKSRRIYFKPLRPEEALVRTLSRHIHFFLYTERPLAEKIFFTAADFFKTIPAYEMHFRKDRNFWSALGKMMK